MEQRRSERAQFFNAVDEQGMHPVWVFRRTVVEATLGLMVNISRGGVQILTSKDTPLDGDVYKLIVFIDRDGVTTSHSAIVSRQWSGSEGTLYLKHGFAFEESTEVAGGMVQSVIAAREAGEKWFRCELLDLRAPETLLN